MATRLEPSGVTELRNVLTLEGADRIEDMVEGRPATLGLLKFRGATAARD